MKIVDHNINMNSKTVEKSTFTEIETLNKWSKFEKLNSDDINLDKLDISKLGLEYTYSELSFLSFEELSDLGVKEDYFTEEDKLKIQLLEDFISTLRGKKFRFKGISFYKVREKFKNKKDDYMKKNSQTKKIVIGQNWGFHYKKISEYHEGQSMKFSTNGIVKTKDGRSIEINYNLNLSREFYSKREIEILAGQETVDPLVINYDGKGTRLTEEKHSFDLDYDGKSDQISFLENGSGFLVYDKNSNNKIDDGRELFGPSTGAGFSELSDYDDDQNSWIDEEDEIFDKLRIWHINNRGQKELIGLGEKGIGAIYLKSVNGEFEFRSKENQGQGRIKNNSISLTEEGKTLVVHEIDFII